eukprot:gene17826-12775_t
MRLDSIAVESTAMPLLVPPLFHTIDPAASAAPTGCATCTFMTRRACTAATAPSAPRVGRGEDDVALALAHDAAVVGRGVVASGVVGVTGVGRVGVNCGAELTSLTLWSCRVLCAAHMRRFVVRGPWQQLRRLLLEMIGDLDGDADDDAADEAEAEAAFVSPFEELR